MLYSPVNFPFVEQIREATLREVQDLNSESVYLRNIPVSDELRHSMNNYLAERGISKIKNILCFKKKNYASHYKITHIDSSGDQIIKCSMVIPVQGCKNTKQQWFDGDYGKKVITRVDGTTFLYVEWKAPGVLLDEVEINDSPMLCKVDIPHNAYNLSDDYRITCTLRFQANEDFDYLLSRLG